MAKKAVLAEGSAITDDNKDEVIDEMIDALFEGDEAVAEEGDAPDDE